MATQEIGFDIDFNPANGSFINVELVDGKLQLKNVGKTYDGIEDIYASYGAWISNPFDLVDKYAQLGNLAMNVEVAEGVSYIAYTSVSDDKETWDEWVAMNVDTGEMQSEPKRYIKIKLELTGSVDEKIETVYSFEETDKEKFEENQFVQFDGQLKLKRDYSYQMEHDSLWNGEGAVLRKVIKKSDFKKIDSLI